MTESFFKQNSLQINSSMRDFTSSHELQVEKSRELPVDLRANTAELQMKVTMSGCRVVTHERKDNAKREDFMKDLLRVEITIINPISHHCLVLKLIFNVRKNYSLSF